MSLHVGGLYVLANESIDREAVIAAIREYWRKRGAKPLTGDPLSLEPLSVQKTGKLGFVVAPASADAKKRTWIAVYDSERYHADGELAQALAEALETAVVDYAFTGSVDQASVAVYGRGRDKLERETGSAARASVS
jgi:hypothetical protein